MSFWALPPTARKWHYFRGDGLSLCGKWMFAGYIDKGHKDSPANCVECTRRVQKLSAVAP